MRKLILHLLLAGSILSPLVPQPTKAQSSRFSQTAQMAVSLATTLCFVDRKGLSFQEAGRYLASVHGESAALAAINSPTMKAKAYSVYRRLDRNCDLNEYGAEQVLRENPDF